VETHAPTNVRTTVGVMACVILREHGVDLKQEEREHLEKVALEYMRGEKNG
jgi:transcription antitermination factor NusG